MKKILILISILISLIIGIAVFGYVIIKRATSDEAIKNRLLSTLRDFGQAEIGHVHMDFFDGIIIDNLTFTGTSDDIEGKSLKIPKIVLKHSPQSLVKGQININNAIIVSPELTVEKPSDIWSLLDILKTNFDKADMPTYTDALSNGIEVRNLKVHIKEDPETKSPEIKLSGINIAFQPYAGSFKDIIAKGDIHDEFLGDYSFTIRLHPDIPSLDVEIYTRNLMLGEVFLSRFPYIGKDLWDDYKPTGKVSVSCKANFNNRDKQKKMDYIINVGLNGLKIIYEDWPFLIYDLSGGIELNAEKLYLKKVVGYLKSGTMASQAEFKGEFDLYGSQKNFMITIPNLFVNQELLKNIPEFGEQVWQKARPTGFVDLNFQYNETEKQEGYSFLTIDSKGLEINPSDFSFPMTYVNGQFKLCNNMILFKNVNGFIQCGDQSIFTEMNGIYDMKSDRKIFNFHVPNLLITESLLKNLPEKEIGEKLWIHLNPRGKVNVTANFQGFKEEKDNKFCVEIDLKNCEIGDRKHAFFLWGIGGLLEINKDRIFSKHIDAKCYDGHVEGTLSVNTDTDPCQYKGELNFSNINIEELTQSAAKVEKPWSGLLLGRVKYHGSGTNPKDFYAEGQLNVNRGYLSDVPIVLSIFNFLNLSIPKKESFHSAQARFTIKNGFIKIDEGRIYSDSVELDGRGVISLNGDLHLTIVAGFGKGVLSQLPIVGRVFDFIVGGVRKQLTMVEVKGTFLRPEIHPVPFKPIRKSIKNMFDLLPEDKQDTSDENIKE
jgi:hypothetical protein